jgi:2-hydroxy-3-keto-5-methylthiopentenyl-1-phosphate phosphatase
MIEKIGIPTTEPTDRLMADIGLRENINEIIDWINKHQQDCSLNIDREDYKTINQQP